MEEQMPLYEIGVDRIQSIPKTSFSTAGLRERDDLQRLLRDQADVISPGTMIIAEEFGDWTEGSRRIDLLGVDSTGCLVVIELKRTEDGGLMDLQALRYAAMVSTMTFEQGVEAHRRYLLKRGDSITDPAEKILSHLSTGSEADFNNFVRIVLVAADFLKEITTSVLWLNSQNLDIR